MARGPLYSKEEREWIVETHLRTGGVIKRTWELHGGSGLWPKRTRRALQTVILKDPDVAGPIAARQSELIDHARRLDRGGEPGEAPPVDARSSVRVKGLADGTLELKGPPVEGAASWADLLRSVGMNPDDYTLVRLSLNVNPEGLTQSWVVVRPHVPTTGALAAAQQGFLDRVEALGGVVSTTDTSPGGGRPHPRLLVLAVPDLHLGKMAWGQETGSSYDLQIAGSMYRDAVSSILRRGAQVGFDEVEVPLGHDYFHVDALMDGKVPTTFKGTPQDVDGRWQKAFDLGVTLAVWTIERALEFAGRVTVVQVPGNHDTTKSYMVARTVEAWFRANERVSFDIGPNPRKFTRWGNVGLMHTHGADEKPQNLASLFQIEAPLMWGETLFREVLMGHLHKKREWMDEQGGIVYNRLGSLSGADAWHHEQGWKGAVRTARGIIYCAHEGRIADVHHNVVPDPQPHLDPVDRAATSGVLSATGGPKAS